MKILYENMLIQLSLTYPIYQTSYIYKILIFGIYFCFTLSNASLVVYNLINES